MSNILTNNINPRSGSKITIGGVNDTVSIAGTVTYEDVTSVDSVGLITARSGIHVTGAGSSVGIGTDDPEQSLHVRGDIRVKTSRPVVRYKSLNDAHQYFAGADVNDTFDGGYQIGVGHGIGVGAAGTTAFCLTSAARIGIGTTVPDERLEVGDGTVSGGLKVSGQSSSVTSDGFTVDWESSSNSTRFFSEPSSGGSSAIRFFVTHSGTRNERLRIQSNGNTGIGSDAPSQKLNIDGNLMLDGNDQFCYLSSVGTGNNGIYVRGNSQSASTGDHFLRSHSTGYFTWESGGSHRMQLNADGTLVVGASGYSFGTVGARISQVSDAHFTRAGGNVIAIRRNTNDGSLLDFYRDSTLEGNVNVSSGLVAISGAHLTRWTQLPDNAERTEILMGTVLTNLDEMCEWGDEDNLQLNRMKISDVEGDVNVAGVFQSWDDDDDTYLNDYYCAMTGDFIIRIAQGTTVARGDLLMSAGDGTAKPQGDDIVRSKTVAKVTSTTVSTTYSDGSYCVPCVLMAC